MDGSVPSNPDPESKVDGRTTSGSKHAHDEHGHFTHVENPYTNPMQQDPGLPQQTSHLNPVSQFLHDETAIHKTYGDELIDVHIGNPLRKISVLLEEIKRQKAFSFSIKGSLGLMGIVVVLGTFGVLGGTRALCSKGSQTKLGKIQTLMHTDTKENFLLKYIPFVNHFLIPEKIKRQVLVLQNNEIIKLDLKNSVSIPSTGEDLTANNYYVTGDFDSCSQSLTIEESLDLQPTQ